jgi:uncharacterized spore protein YtfJ
MNVDEMLTGVRDALTVKRVYGDPIERDGILIIPAAKLRGGGGGGSDSENNAGGGFGLTAKPVGAFVVRNGTVEFEPAVDVNRVVGLGVLAFIVAIWSWRSVAKARAKAAAR